ncbi:Ig-like domain-containing protein [Novosphingobium sp. HR1a]|uniref:Ig-like domain-containing protein n=1 Tax=Novosphingobium sp. HR1a TaxID=1395637 RepID=UPI001B3C66AF|nr:Ig-like domain-containing protein [Novosphingobium sp. HR1a]MBF7014635.1 BapA prefix-like domain-containing protein [Novosphingobium sp. HR1a]
MPVEAKISSDLSGVRIAPVQAVEGSVSVAPGSSIALNVAPEAVTGFSREGTDLLVHLRTGETVRIANFYVDPSRFSQLMLVEEDHLVAADVAQLSGSSLATPAYVPMDVIAGFAAPPATEAAGMVAGAASGAGLGAGVIVPLAVLGGGGLIAVAAGGGGGNRGGNDTPTTPPDTTAPAAPSNLVVSAAGDRLTGRAEAGATVLVDTDGDGTANYTSIVGADGAFTVVLAPALVNAEPISVTVRDAAGNVGPAAGTNAPDLTPPENATQLGVAADGTGITGTGEPGATVTIDIDGDGEPDYTATIAADGTFSVLFAAPVDNGRPITVRVTDAAGNMSDAATVRAPDLTPPPATAPTIAPSNGTALTGTAGSGIAVMLTDAAGHTVGQATIAADGTWSFTPQPPLTNGTVIRVAAVNLEGQAGPAASITIDSLAPDAPTLSPSNGTEIGGKAEAGTTILVTDGSGTPLGQAITGIDGAWSMTPANPVPDGTILIAIARDAAGNSSPPTSTAVDAMAPPAPTLAPPNATTVSGTAEPGATLILSDGNGDPIGETSADSDGNWTFTPSPPLPDGTSVNAVARDAAGNESASDSIVIDAVSPAAPEIAPTNGTVISGTSEPGALILLTAGNGDPIGQTLAEADGNWSFVPGPPLADGTGVSATAQDAAGNASPASTTTVDAIAPDAPSIDSTDGNALTGTAEPNTVVTLTDGDGNPIGDTSADGGGNWSFTPGARLSDGTVVTATARDAAGNVSPASTTTVDSTAPADPTIDPTNGSLVTGTAEPNSTVVLMDGTGNTFAAFSPQASPGGFTVFAASSAVPDYGLPLGQVTTDPQGNWTFTPLLPLPDGTVVIAVSVDAAGNVSGPVSTTVDGVPPAIPTIDPTTGALLEGNAEPGVTLLLSDSLGNPIGETTADDNGDWTFVPTLALPHDTVVEVVAVDAAGNTSLPASTVVDAVAPVAPIIAASSGDVLTGTAEPGTTIILTDGLGIPLGEAIVDQNGGWIFTPSTPLPDSTVVEAFAIDAAGNISPVSTVTIDATAPDSPVLTLVSGGELLLISAEPGVTVRVVIDGETANPIQVTVDGNGNFSLPLLTPLIANETVSAIAIDAAGNQSLPTVLIAPDIAPLTIAVVEADDGYINANEAADGIQVEVTLRPTMQAGQQITAALNGQGGYQAQATHVLSVGDILAGVVVLTIAPAGGFPEGASSVSASIGGGDGASPVNFVIDTSPPATPVLSLLASALTISGEPGSQLTVTATVGGLTTNTVVTADNSGLASLNLLTDLGIRLDWAQLLDARISVTSEDPAGNTSSVATIDVAPNIEAPPTIGGFGLAVSLNPLNPQFGISGTTEPNSTVVIRVVTPVLNVELLPLTADGSGHFTLNLLSPAILTQLGLNVTDILNLGSQISLGMVATDPQGHESAIYGLSLSPNGLSLNLGQIDVNGSLADDIISGTTGAEHINGNSGNDLVLNVGAGDHVLTGPGHDTVEVLATNFSTIDGGAGFDTILLGNGIDLDYGAPGVGTLSNIERIDLGTGDSGSVLTLTASEVSAITDAGHTLQITGESNDVLNITGAVDTGSTQTLDGLVYDVYTFGVSTILVEDNTVQVVV